MLLESGEYCWRSITLEGWISCTTINKGNNNKNSRQVWSRWNGARSHIQSEMDRTKRKCYGVPTSISWFNASWLLPLGNFKNMMYTTKPQTMEELRDQIEHTINDIPLATIQMVCCSVRHCCWECTVAEGGHFEHVRA